MGRAVAKPKKKKKKKGGKILCGRTEKSVELLSIVVFVRLAALPHFLLLGLITCYHDLFSKQTQ